MTATTETRTSVTQAGSGANNPGSPGPCHLPCDCNSGGAGAVASPPVPDETPVPAGADEIGQKLKGKVRIEFHDRTILEDHFFKLPKDDIESEELFEFDLRPLPDDDSDPQAFPRSRRLICSTSSDGQTTFHRFGETGLVLTAEETLQAYEFLANTATVWRQAL